MCMVLKSVSRQPVMFTWPKTACVFTRTLYYLLHLTANYHAFQSFLYKYSIYYRFYNWCVLVRLMYTIYYLPLFFPYKWKFGVQVLYIYLGVFIFIQFDLCVPVLQYICHFSSPKISVDTHSTFILYSSTPPLVLQCLFIACLFL
jgi:hypothetical protein